MLLSNQNKPAVLQRRKHKRTLKEETGGRGHPKTLDRKGTISEMEKEKEKEKSKSFYANYQYPH